MHGLIPRHRRKAGSGPPAIALIAWIGADRRLRSAVENAQSHRRDTDLAAPANTRWATVAVAACFVLVCGAILSITATMSDGVSGGSSALPMPGQANAATPGQAVPPVPPEEANPNNPAGYSAPAPVAPTVVNRQAPQSTSGLSTNGHDDHLAPDHPGGYVASGATNPPAHPASPRRADNPGVSTAPLAPAKPSGFGRSATTRQPADRGTLAAPAPSGNPAQPDDTGTLDGVGRPAAPGKPGDMGALANVADAGKPATSGPPSARISAGNQKSTSATRGSASPGGSTSHLGSASRQDRTPRRDRLIDDAPLP